MLHYQDIIKRNLPVKLWYFSFNHNRLMPGYEWIVTLLPYFRKVLALPSTLISQTMICKDTRNLMIHSRLKRCICLDLHHLLNSMFLIKSHSFSKSMSRDINVRSYFLTQVYIPILLIPLDYMKPLQSAFMHVIEGYTKSLYLVWL